MRRFRRKQTVLCLALCLALSLAAPMRVNGRPAYGGQAYSLSLDPCIYYDSRYLTQEQALTLIRPELADGTPLNWNEGIPAGDTVYIHAEPVAAYRVSSVEMIAGVEYKSLSRDTDGRYRLTMPDDDASIHIYVSDLPQYSVLAVGDNGSLAFPDGYRYPAGTEVRFTVTPDEGWTVDSVSAADPSGAAVPLTGLADGSYRFIMPEGNVTVSARYRERGRSVPGGVVSDCDSLVTALGGAVTVEPGQGAAGDAAVLTDNLILRESLIFRGVSLTLCGAGFALSAPVGSCAISVERGASLTLDGSLRVETQANDESEGDCLVAVRGGALYLRQVSVRSASGTNRDAIHMSDGVLVLNGDGERPSARGGGSGCGLRITGGSAVMLGGCLEGIVISGGRLELRGGIVDPGCLTGSAMTVSGTAEILLRGGTLRCAISRDPETQTDRVAAPSVRLPQGVTLASVLAEGCTITRRDEASDAHSVAEALAASEVRCGFAVAPDPTVPEPTPTMLPLEADADAVRVLLPFEPSEGATAMAALYDGDGRFLEYSAVRIDAPTAFVSLPLSGKSARAADAGVFLLDPDGAPMLSAARTGLSDPIR